MSDNTCPLCGKPSNVRGHSTRDLYHVDCPECGCFGITLEARRDVKNIDADKRLCVRAWIANSQRQSTLLPCLCSSPNADRDKQYVNFTVEMAVNERPATIPDWFDLILVRFAERCRKPSDVICWNDARLAASCFCEGPADLGYFCRQFAYLNRLESLVDASVQITATGWNYIAELQRGRLGGGLRQAFVAMWFGNEQREERENGLKRGIEAAGYTPWIADRVEFAGKIDDKIIAEIRKSKFLVADLTGQRPNVYFEAGFAEGLGKTAIYTCHETDIKECHIDKRQENIIVWPNADELATRLQNRIEAVIGRPA